MARKRTARSGTWIALALLVFAGPSYGSTFRVHFPDGRTLDVAAARVEAGQAHLELGEGNTLILPASRVVRIEAIEAPPNPTVQDHSPASSPVSDYVQPLAARAAEEQAAVVAAAPPSLDLEGMIQQAAKRHGLEPDLLAAVISVESGYRPDVVSPKGALGLMQLMPATARDLAVTDPLDARQNIEGGARYLRQLLDTHDGAYWKALAAYNAGGGRVKRYKGLPPYRETIQYVKRVLHRYQHPEAPPSRPDQAVETPTGLRLNPG